MNLKHAAESRKSTQAIGALIKTEKLLAFSRLKGFYQNASLVGMVITVFSLSACSQTSEMSRLKHQYENHTYSTYVNNSLKAQDTSTVNSQVAKSNIKVMQKQLAAKKLRSTSPITNTIRHNNLFTPTQGVQQQVALLAGRMADENWLKKHSDLGSVLTLVLKNNLDIQSRLQETQASLAKYDQVSFLDDTLAQYAAFTKDLAVPVGKKKHNKSVADSFPFSGLLSLKASIIDQSVESSRLQLKQTVQDTITQTRIAYYELQSAKQEISIISSKIELLQSLKKQLKDSYSTQATELGNILQVDIEIEKNRNKRQVIRNKIIAQQARLNALLNLSPMFTLGKTGKFRPVELTHSTQKLLATGKRHRVEIARLQSELKKMERIIQLSEKRFYPDFSAGYSRFQNQTSIQTGSNASKAAFSTRPSFKKRNFFGTNDAYLNETKLKYKALQAKLNALQNKTEDDIQQTLSNYRTQKSNHHLYQSKVIPQSKTTLDIAKSLFETGNSSYPKVIEIQTMILDYRLLSLNSIKGMNINAAKLSRFVGQAL